MNKSFSVRFLRCCENDLPKFCVQNFYNIHKILSNCKFAFLHLDKYTHICYNIMYKILSKRRLCGVGYGQKGMEKHYILSVFRIYHTNSPQGERKVEYIGEIISQTRIMQHLGCGNGIKLNGLHAAG